MKWLRYLFGFSSDSHAKKAGAPELAERREKEPYPPLPEIDPATAPSQGFAQPHFRFFPGAYEFGVDGEAVFKRHNGPCHCCGMRDIYAYQKRPYWIRRDEPVICAQCIADGRLGILIDNGDNYSMHDCQIEGVSDDNPDIEEIEQRTPGFATYNPFDWASIDGEPMAFMGYGDEEKWKYVGEARAAMCETYGGQDAYPSPYFLLFKELDGNRYRATLDLD